MLPPFMGQYRSAAPKQPSRRFAWSHRFGWLDPGGGQRRQLQFSLEDLVAGARIRP
jgi:hypothetical protein